MAGRKKKNRVSPFAATQPLVPENDRTEDEQLFAEVDQRMTMLDRDSIYRDREYQKAFKQVVDKTGKGSPYTAGDKLRATLALVITASAAKASRISGVPASTIRAWKNTAPWWPKAIEYALLCKKEELDSDYTEIQELANQAVKDSLTNGDQKLDRNGEVVHVKMSGKDAMMVSAIARDKQALLRGQPTSISEKVSDQDRLEELAATIVNAVKDSGKVIEGVVVREEDEE